ncbi:MAG: hypothetical protein CV080_06840, partial [Candidatus Kuenenia stuttgartiensis]
MPLQELQKTYEEIEFLVDLMDEESDERTTAEIVG